MIMDKYAVVKKIGSCTPMLDETFEDKDAAIAYTNALRSKQGKWEYAVYQLCEGL